MHHLKVILLLIVSVLLSFDNHGYAQDVRTYDLEHVAEKYDLVSTDINCIFQDVRGFLWLGTKAGLSRFDGIDFSNFTFTQGRSISEINVIVQDKRGVIWAGGSKGLYYYYQGQLSKVDQISENITSLHIDKDDQLLVGGLLFIPCALSPGQRKSMLEGQKVSIEPLVEAVEWKRIVQNSRVWNISGDLHGDIWIGSDNQLLMLAQGRLEVYWEDHSQKVLVSEIVAINRDSIYWGSESTGLFFGTKNHFSQIITPATYISHVTDTAFYFLSAMDLIRLDAGGIKSIYDFSDAQDLYFKDLLLDHEGNFWIATEGDLLKLTPKIFDNWSVQNYPLLTANFSIEELNDGKIIIGSSKEKILSVEPEGFEIFDRISAPSNSITEAVHQDKQGNLWYGTSMGGIVWYNNQAHRTFGVDDGLFDTEISFFQELSDGTFWCGGYNGICQISQPGEDYIFRSYSYAQNRVDVPVFISLVEGPDESIWAISDNGIFKVLKDKLVKYSLDLDQDLPPISGLSTGREHIFFISTQGGGIWELHFNAAGKPEVYKKYTKQLGLISDVALNVHVDTLGNVWAFYQNGISRFKYDNTTLHIRNYGREDGLMVEPTAQIEVVESSNGYLWLLRKTSISRFPLYQSYLSRTIPDTYVLEVSLRDEDDIFKYARSKTIDGLPLDITLPSDKNFLEFKFTSSSFTRPGKNLFQYRLEGLEDNWSKKTDGIAAQYRGLNPGEYTFYVQAFNGDGIPGKVSSPLKFTILKPWYARWWALISFVSLGILLFYFAYDYHQDKRRKEVESKRLKELDRVKNNMYTNITHEFRTPLTLILGYIEELNNKMEDEAERGLLNNIGENSQRLLKMVNDILELSKLEGSKVTLHLEQDDLVVYLRYLIDRFQPLAQNNHIDLSFISHDHHVVMDFDRERLGSIIINLISNAIRAVGLDGRITVELRKQQRSSEPHACIVVRDNGIGIPKEDLPLIFQKYYQVETDKMVPGTTGIGLALVYDLVSLMQGSISVESDDQGTIFTILLPMTNDAPTVQYEDDLVDRSPVVEVGDRSLILLIEDNKDLAKFIKRVLSRSYDVIYAVNGADGLSLAQERLPDLIVSDVMMPDIDGYQVCQQLKNDLKTDHIPVILLTAKAGQENKNYAISLGADAYIIKPFSQDELLLRIHQLIEIRNKLAEKFGGGLMEVMSSNKMDKQSIFIRRVVGCINEHMEDADFGVSQLAQKLSLSESQLYRKIKSLSGKSTAIFIRSVRLEKAKVMLEGGDVGVSEVAYATGFNDPSWFSRAFKKEFGIVPSLVTQGDDD